MLIDGNDNRAELIQEQGFTNSNAVIDIAGDGNAVRARQGYFGDENLASITLTGNANQVDLAQGEYLSANESAIHATGSSNILDVQQGGEGGFNSSSLEVSGDLNELHVNQASLDGGGFFLMDSFVHVDGSLNIASVEQAGVSDQNSSRLRMVGSQNSVQVEQGGDEVDPNFPAALRSDNFSEITIAGTGNT